MRTFIRGLVMAMVVAGFLGSAGLALANGNLECTVTKDGKKTTQMVATGAECTKLGGKLVAPSHPTSTKK